MGPTMGIMEAYAMEEMGQSVTCAYSSRPKWSWRVHYHLHCPTWPFSDGYIQVHTCPCICAESCLVVCSEHFGLPTPVLGLTPPVSAPYEHNLPRTSPVSAKRPKPPAARNLLIVPFSHALGRPELPVFSKTSSIEPRV